MIKTFLLKSYERLLEIVWRSGNRKARRELIYWEIRKNEEKVLSNKHYQTFFTTIFGLDVTFYAKKKILDIGCGPRGSLKWTENTAQCVGLDPLAHSYRMLGTREHQMYYVSANSEQMPFLDEHFDVVSSFNSLDHVDDLTETISEIIRVVTPGGHFLLLTDLNHDPTTCEPQSFSWDIVEKFLPDLEILEEKHFEKNEDGIYQSILKAIPYDHQSSLKRYGILIAKFRKKVRHASITA